MTMPEADQQEQTTYLLLTGASSGIGREMAVALSGRHRLILNGRDLQRLEETRQACSSPEDHLLWPADLVDVESLATSLPEFLEQRKVYVGAFIHCAAMLDVLPLRSITTQLAQNTMRVNFHSAMEITRLLMRKNVNLRHLQNIVFISSIASRFGARGFTAYCPSKAALDGLMRALAVELAPDVRVNSILPGGIRTPMTQAMYDDPETAARLTRDYPLGIGTPADVIDAVEFLISGKARWITGQEWVVDGGRSINISA
jgi:NAD(P)-dependent dehydrogenase (short-subunit alcohol dehydrogenase family)